MSSKLNSGIHYAYMLGGANWGMLMGIALLTGNTV